MFIYLRSSDLFMFSGEIKTIFPKNVLVRTEENRKAKTRKT